MTDTMPTATETPPPAAPAPPAARHRTVITPPGAWQWVDVGELWRYRELFATFVFRDIRVRYKQTTLGVAWAVLQPLMMMVIFTVFFGRLANLPTGLPPGHEPLFFLTGLLPWTFFSASLTAAAGSVLNAERLITKIYFPRLLVPFAVVGSTAADHLIACGLLGVALAAFGYLPTWSLLALPAVSLILAVAATGAGTLLAALNVSFRDVRYVIPFGVQMLMFATPTIFMQPEPGRAGALGWVLALNPLNTAVAAFRACALGTPVPWAGLAVCAAVAAVLLVLGCLYYRRVEDQFADII